MADLKISDMTAIGTIRGAELAECVQSGSNKKWTFADIAEWILTPTINTQFDGDYTLQPVDNDGKTIVRMNNASSNTCTIPSTQTKTVTVRQVGAGITTLVAGSGVTLNGNLVFSDANYAKSIVPVGDGVYDVYGAQ